MDKLLLFCCIGLSIHGFGQTNYTVTAGGNTWSTNSLTIDVGDSITFINLNNGSHNINGTSEAFPFNPESFGMTRVSENWVYGFRFMTPGTYSFRCDLHPSMMGGTIVVHEVAGITENVLTNVVYPNPSEGEIFLNLPVSDAHIKVFDMLGNLVFSEQHFTGSRLDLSGLNPGVYLFQMRSTAISGSQRIIKK